MIASPASSWCRHRARFTGPRLAPGKDNDCQPRGSSKSKHSDYLARSRSSQESKHSECSKTAWSGPNRCSQNSVRRTEFTVPSLPSPRALGVQVFRVVLVIPAFKAPRAVFLSGECVPVFRLCSQRGFYGPPLLFVAMPGCSCRHVMSRSVVAMSCPEVFLFTTPCPEVFLIVFAPCSGLVVRLLLSVWFFCHMDDGAANTHDIFVDPTTVRLLGLQFCQTFCVR